MGYQEQLKLIEDRKLNGSNSLYIGTPYAGTGNAIFSDAPFAMNQSDYRKSRRDSGNNKNYSSHSVPFEFFVSMPKHLSEAPMFVNNGNKISVITPYAMNDETGKPSYVIAGIWKDQQMETDTVNLAKSAYPLKDFINQIVRAAESGKLIVTNKNKAAEMLTTIGIQPAEVSNILNLAKDSISQSDDSVKEQFSIKRDSALDGLAEEELLEIAYKASEGLDKEAIFDDYDTEELSVDEKLAQMREDYGTIPKGEKPFRDVELPERTAEDKYVSQTVRTILEAKATPDVALKPIETLVAEGELSFDRYTDKAAIADANATIKNKGFSDAYADWKKGGISKKNTVTAVGHRGKSL